MSRFESIVDRTNLCLQIFDVIVVLDGVRKSIQSLRIASTTVLQAHRGFIRRCHTLQIFSSSLAHRPRVLWSRDLLDQDRHVMQACQCPFLTTSSRPDTVVSSNLSRLSSSLCTLSSSAGRPQSEDNRKSDVPLRVASSKSAVSTAAPGRWTYRTTLPLMKTFFTED